MAKNDYSSYDRGTRDCVGAVFNDVSTAEKVIRNLQQAGFSQNEIGFASASREDAEELSRTGVSASVEPVSTDGNSNFDSSSRASDSRDDNKGFWSRLFGSDDSNANDNNAYNPDRSELEQVLVNLGIPAEEARYFEDQVEDGKVLVTVRSGRSRAEEALRILHGGEADFGDRGYAADYSAQRGERLNRTNEYDNLDNNRDLDRDSNRRIELRGEVLRAHKERVQRGEAVIRKEVITENRRIDVPVEREELVVQRRDVQGERPAQGNISAEEIRVPLSEEEVRVEKKPVVTGEVSIGKRKVQDTRHIDTEVKREEIRQQDTDVRTNLRDKEEDAA